MTYQFCDCGKDVEKTRFAISTGQTIDAMMFLVPKGTMNKQCIEQMQPGARTHILSSVVGTMNKQCIEQMQRLFTAQFEAQFLAQ